MTRFRLALVSLAGLMLAAIALAESSLPPAVELAEKVITPERLRAHTAFLADDLLEGRGPATRGGELAAKYIAAQFAGLGLKPISQDGSYFQDVPLLGRKIEPPADLRVAGRAQELTLKFVDDIVSGSDLEQEQVRVAGDLVFVGYGIVAPEFQWDDFKGADLKGKILLMLVNDPPATRDEPALFGGKALTYYGRWTYKYESAARQGAAGAILIHTTPSAGYPFKVVQSTWSGERFSLPRKAGGDPLLGLKAWISREAAEKILALAGQNLPALEEAAAERRFRPLPLGVKVSTEFKQRLRQIQTANVIGWLPGSDPQLREQYVVYTAHYDHLGVGKEVEGDAIYNGAADNAVGVAALLGLAEAFARQPEPPARSVVFIGIAAEEYGLLGSEYYAKNPVFPPARTAANVNIDGVNTIGPTRDITLIGFGKSDLDELVKQVAGEHGLETRPDNFPEQGFFYRSDQFNFAKVGIPAVYLDNGLDVIGRPEGWGKQKADDYTARDYHQPSDQIKPDWDWRGAQQQTVLLFDIGWRVATRPALPEWYPAAEFRPARQESLRPAGEPRH